MKALEKEIMERRIKENGEDMTMIDAQEIFASLIAAISKYHRAQSNPDGRYLERAKANLIEEIADASIMVDLLKLMVKGNHTEMRAAKVERMAARGRTENPKKTPKF